MDQELAAAAAEDGLTLLEVTGIVRDEGTIVVLQGTDITGRVVHFACDHRMAQDIVDGLEEGTEVLTAVEPWAILNDRGVTDVLTALVGLDADDLPPPTVENITEWGIALSDGYEGIEAGEVALYRQTPDDDGTSGQDRESYTDDQDRDEYTVDDDYERRAGK